MPEHANLSIGDVSKITGLPSHTIRYWKGFSEFLSPNRTIGQQRRYSENDIGTIEEIRHLLKVEKFSIAGAKRQLGRKQVASISAQESRVGVLGSAQFSGSRILTETL